MATETKPKASNIPANARCVYKVGEWYLCVFGDFVSTEKSSVGEGLTPIEAICDLDSQDECEVCDGNGWVPAENKWSVDTGTKWQRNFVETGMRQECPECNGLRYKHPY